MPLVFVSAIVMAAVGLIFASILALLSNFLRVQEDPRVEKIVKILPGINCGACGFSGCLAFAQAVVAGEKDKYCLPGGDEINRQISQLLGISYQKKNREKKIVVYCAAEEDDKMKSRIYHGPKSCEYANLLGGDYSCFYGCLGLADCIKICPVQALSFNKGKVVVDHQRCIKCGKCVEKCPRDLLALIDLPEKINIYQVGCNNRDKGVMVKKVCKKGCIGCGICVRLPNSPFELKNNLARANLEKINKDNSPVLEQAAIKCPSKCINPV